MILLILKNIQIELFRKSPWVALDWRLFFRPVLGVYLYNLTDVFRNGEENCHLHENKNVIVVSFKVL